MDFVNGGQSVRVDAPGKLDQRGPQPSVNIADFAIDEPTNQNLTCLSERSRDFPNLLSFSVSPPASANWDPGNPLSQVWNRTASGFKDNTSIFHELNGVLYGHRVRKYNQIGLTQQSSAADGVDLKIAPPQLNPIAKTEPCPFTRKRKMKLSVMRRCRTFRGLGHGGWPTN